MTAGAVEAEKPTNTTGPPLGLREVEAPSVGGGFGGGEVLLEDEVPAVVPEAEIFCDGVVDGDEFTDAAPNGIVAEGEVSGSRADRFGQSCEAVFAVPGGGEAVDVEHVAVEIVLRHFSGGRTGDVCVLVEFVGLVAEASVGLGGRGAIADRVVVVGGEVGTHLSGGEFGTGVVAEGVGGDRAGGGFVEALGAPTGGIVVVIENGYGGGAVEVVDAVDEVAMRFVILDVGGDSGTSAGNGVGGGVEQVAVG